MPLGAPPPLAFALSWPGAAAGCWACARRVMSAAKAATNTSVIRSFMTDDCTRNGGRLLRGQVHCSSVASQFVTMVMGVFAPWSSGGDPSAWHRKKRGTDIVDLADVGMIERRDGVSFLLETRRVLALQALDADDAIEARVARLVDLSHAARPDGREDFVRAEFVAGRQNQALA